MAKIRINKLPDGFEIKDGKVVKKMQQGGMMTGDQSNYGLVTSPYNLSNDQFNNNSDNNVRYSLSSVPRDMANLEAEGGETVLTDLNNDGQFGLYNITGPRHSKGGVPMYLPEQSFVFSDTPKMKLNRQELAEFGIESRKKMTPAKVSKKYQLNEFIGAIGDRDADLIKVKSAELMLDKNMKSLSKLAFGQESKKQFSDGVPLAAYPFLTSKGIDPIEFTQKVENINKEQATMKAMQALPPQQQAQIFALRDAMSQMQPQARYGGEGLPSYQDQGETPSWLANANIRGDRYFNGYNYGQFPFQKHEPDATYVAPKYPIYNDDRLAREWKPDVETQLYDKYFPGDLNQNSNATEYEGDFDFDATMKASGFVWDPEQKVYLRKPVNTANSSSGSSNTSSSSGSSSSGSSSGARTRSRGTGVGNSRILDVSGMKGGRSLGQGYKDYQDLERLFNSQDPMWVETTDRAYKAFVANLKARGYTDDQIPSKDKAIASFLKYQKNNYIVSDLAEDSYRYATQLDRGSDDADDVKKNENTQKLFNKLQELYPDLYEGYQIDEEETKLNQAFFQAIAIADKDNKEQYLDYIASGPNQDSNWLDNKTISKAEGFYGNNTLNQVVKVSEPIEPEKKTGCKCADGTYSDECCEKKTIETPREYYTPDPEYYTQDLLKLGALAQRDRNLFLPWEPNYERGQFNYVLEEPTRAIADTNEQLNIFMQGINSYGNPQALNARASQAQSEAFGKNANTLAQVHNRNIGTVNRGLLAQAQLDMQTQQLQNQAKKRQYDNTQLALDNFTNEKNLDREQFADLMANAETNMAYTYNLNSLNPYYNIRPSRSGIIDFTGGIPLVPNQNAANALSREEQIIQTAKELEGLQHGSKALDLIYGKTAKNEMEGGADPYADYYRQMRNAGLPYAPLAKKGKEVTKYVVPFYTGKVGS